MSSDDDTFPATPTTSGWYPVNDGSDQETYWDGTAWTKRRQYRFGSPFLEIPLHHGDPPLTTSATTPTPVSTSSIPSSPPTSSGLTRSGPSLASMNQTLSYRSDTQVTAPSPRFRTSRIRIRFLLFVWLIATAGFLVSTFARHGSGPNPQKYFVYLFVLGLVVKLIMGMASTGARREVRDRESERRPRWPFRYLSRLTDGLQGQRLAYFVGGLRIQPRIDPTAYNASVPMARLSIFSNGVRLGPSSSVLSMMVPTWEARFDELDVIQAIGRLKGMTTGILFRKSQSHEWAIFWTTNRETVFIELERIGVTVSREPVRLRLGSQDRVNAFVEDQLHPSKPSVLGTATTATPSTDGPSDASSPLLFAAGLSSVGPDHTTSAPEDTRWPGVVLGVLLGSVGLSIFALVFNLIDKANPAAPGTANGGVVTTVSTPVSATTSSQWRWSVEVDVRNLSPYQVAIPSKIAHLRLNAGTTENARNLSYLKDDLQLVSSFCTVFHKFAVDGAPAPTLAKDAANASAACAALVRADHLDLNSSKNKWTPKLASDDQHWMNVLHERVAVLKSEAAT